MSSIDELLPKEPVNILVEGDSGSGKTCLIGSLLRHGFEVALIDADNGWSVLADPAIVPVDKRHLLSIHRINADDPKALTELRQKLVNWKDGDKNWGSVLNWPPNRVLYLDSLSFITRSVLFYMLDKAGVSFKEFNSAGDLSKNDLGAVYGGLEKNTWRLIYGLTRAPCTFIATGHIRYFMDNQGNITKTGFSTEGSKLMSELPKLFNNVWYLEVDRDKRFLYTQTKAGSKIQCKSENGTVVPPKIENPDLGDLLLKLRNFQ